MRKLLIAFVVAAAVGIVARAQITIPNAFTAGTIADPDAVNTNFSTVGSQALNRTGGTMTGALSSQAITPSSDATYDVGSNALGFRDGWFTRTVTVKGLMDLSGAAAGQIAFPATQNPSSNANTLDDFEEGTWTPVIGGSGGTSGQTYTTQAGKYIKIGKLVIAFFNVALSAKGTITTNVQIQGLPFSIDSTPTNFAGPLTITMFANLNSNWYGLGGFVSATTAAEVRGNPGTAGAPTQGGNSTANTQLSTTDITNTTQFVGHAIYMATQ